MKCIVLKFYVLYIYIDIYEFHVSEHLLKLISIFDDVLKFVFPLKNMLQYKVFTVG